MTVVAADVQLVRASTGEVCPIHSGTVTFDRNWSPFAQASAEVPLDAWDALGIADDASGEPVTVRIAADVDGVAQLGEWALVLVSADRDVLGETVDVRLASWEHRLHTIVRQGTSWMPSGFTPGGTYNVTDLLGRLLFEAGTGWDAIGAGGETELPVDDLEPWEPGTSAWEWFDRYRLEARATVEARVDVAAAAQFIVNPAPAATLAPLPTGLLAHTRTTGGELFADVVTIVWRWNEYGTDQEQRDTAYAAGLTDWRDAARHVELDRNMPPIAGYAQRVVDQMARHRYVHEVERIPGLADLTDSAPYAGARASWRQIRYEFRPDGMLPTQHVTLIREFS